MHAGLVLSGLVALVAATPTVEKQLPNRAASLPAVTASGNGTFSLSPFTSSAVHLGFPPICVADNDNNAG